MADDDDMYSEAVANVSPRNSAEFHIGDKLRHDESLMIFIKKRAPREFVGFVDVTSMAPVTSPQNRGVRVCNVVVNPPVNDHSTFLHGKLEDQLKYLSHNKHGAAAKQLLLTETLPQHDYERNLCAIADCLSADSAAIQRDAAVRLERLIIVSSPHQISAFKNQLLAVVQKTYVVLNDPAMELTPTKEDMDHLRLCGHLHMLALAALLSHVRHRPSLEECRPFMDWPKLNKKQTGYDAKQEVLKVVLAFTKILTNT